ncbi:DUF1801 domain-containing protein [Actinopolymorpha pittospori]|uniref:YdhG-like domain-containing protein n=1 Tax=Actinopolymorpha pittospori TaxID=648752 RepID=A0A927RIA4_9ACTN|nr:DUF1801 domain-containing protein [Actinopolymorpha pittospori]MBE1613080.1 hypothetical protein [Actinopolymorpha pittospori]
MAVDSAVADYIAGLPDGRREIVRAVHERIRVEVPELEVRMWTRFIGYGHYHYRYASGREGDWFPVGLTNNKQYVSLYICAADQEGYLAEANAERLGRVSVGKSCIRFRRLDDLDIDVAGELVRRAAHLVAAGRFAM